MTCYSPPTAPQRPDQGRHSLEKVSFGSPAQNKQVLILCPAAGDAFVRELDVSRITLRLRAKEDKKGEGDSDATIAKLTGSTLDTLRRCLVSPTYTRSVYPSNLRS